MRDIKSVHRLGSTPLTKLSKKLNLMRGGDPKLTICQEEWERRLDGQKLAKVNVKLLDIYFLVVSNEVNHCCRDWQKGRNHDLLQG